MGKTSKEKVFLEQVHQSQGILHKVCRMYCDSATDREDLLQEMMVQLWKAYPSFRGDAQFSTWLYRVAFNVALQYVAQRKKHRSHAAANQKFRVLAAETAPIIEEEQAQRLKDAIAALNTIERAIVLLYLDHKSSEEIGVIMGITPNYVRVKMNRIRNKLKELIKP